MSETQHTKYVNMRLKLAEDLEKNEHFNNPQRKYNAIAFTPDPIVRFVNGKPTQLYYNNENLGDIGFDTSNTTDEAFELTNIARFGAFCEETLNFDLHLCFAVEIGPFTSAYVNDKIIEQFYE